MRLNSISLINFRNYSKNSFLTGGNHVVLLGNNGTGKTNFLEAVHYLAVSRSFRTSEDASLISTNGDFFNISGQTTERGVNHNIDITYTREKEKRIVFDSHRIKAKDLITRMSAVVFHNDDIETIRGSAGTRRRHLDMILSQTDPEYYHSLVVYNHLIRQKKELLKKKTQHLLV
jgi:DNA replication and repair protein RecF